MYSAAVISCLLIVSAGHDGTEKTLASTRKYIVYNPDPAKPNLPLVLAFHGLGHRADYFQKDSKLNDLAETEKFIAVYPMGVDLRWNAGSLGTADDMAFFDELLADLSTTVKHDPHRVYVIGMSNGGMFAYRLAVERSDKIAAVGVVAGSLETLPTPMTKPMPVMHIHGTADKIVPADGSQGFFRPARSTKDAIELWVKHNGAGAASLAKPPLDATPPQVDRIDYPAGTAKAPVTWIQVQGGGHLWLGHDAPPANHLLGIDVTKLGVPNLNVDANKLLWDFLSPHSRP
jgi:polyhydroxybutyrate depolymerase